jgi:hypothetical protein
VGGDVCGKEIPSGEPHVAVLDLDLRALIHERDVVEEQLLEELRDIVLRVGVVVPGGRNDAEVVRDVCLEQRLPRTSARDDVLERSLGADVREDALTLRGSQ